MAKKTIVHRSYDYRIVNEDEVELRSQQDNSVVFSFDFQQAEALLRALEEDEPQFADLAELM